MNYPSIRLEGAILSPDILDRLEDTPGQRPTDFGMEGTARVKDEIARAWADAQDYWRIFQRRLETLRRDSPATTETRQQWMVPLLGLLGYQLEYQARSVELNGKSYAISHRVTNRGNTPLYIIGCREPAGLDRKPEKAVLRMSAHGMVQEYLNLQDELYGLVTNGLVMRLLRDTSRLVKLTDLEFDLDRMFTDGLFADFAVFYRLLHASRLPQTVDAASTCWLERYHQDSLDAGARIRHGLSRAVERAIRDFANGFLAHSANDALRQAAFAGELQPDAYYQCLLRLIYRSLFLMVIDERGLIFPSGTDTTKRDMYDRYYSLQRLRRLAEKRYLTDRRKHDLWLSLLATFRLYWTGQRHPQGQATAAAWAMTYHKSFFHWFLEFPDIIERGGFDCILGNPPYLGGTHLSGTYGQPFCHYVKWEYAPTGLSDLVVYFVRRIYSLLRSGGFTAFITTNSIKDGDIRKDGLEQVLAQGGAINFAVRGIKWPGRANLVVSLVAIHKGEWRGKRVLGGEEVPVISAYFEDSFDTNEPVSLLENTSSIFEGSKFLGNAFLLPHEEARSLIANNERLREVIFPTINGDEIHYHPTQEPGRSIINFFDWPISKAEAYGEAFSRVRNLVKPIRDNDNRTVRRERWWQYAERAIGLYGGILGRERCFAAAATTKYLSFVALPTTYVFTQALKVFTTDRWDLYTVVQSTLHEVWARKYSGALETRLSYSPSDCFDTFPFPEGLWQTTNPTLADIGKHYHEHRRTIMHQLWLGLTDIYNLFHTRDLTPARVAKVSKKSPEEAEAGYQSILALRRLHQELDESVRDAYGWDNLDLGHDFHEVETLPENDRVRYTISPMARKEVLRHLLSLNHQRAVAQAAALPVTKKHGKRSKAKADGNTPELF